VNRSGVKVLMRNAQRWQKVNRWERTWKKQTRKMNKGERGKKNEIGSCFIEEQGTK